MFGLISKKRLAEEAIKIYEDEDTSKAYSDDDFMYRAGNANALNKLCFRFGVDLTSIIRNRRANDV